MFFSAFLRLGGSNLFMDKVRIGIVGTGYIGNVHGRIYSRDNRTEVSALFDIVPDRAHQTARTIGGKVCSSRDELLEKIEAFEQQRLARQPWLVKTV